MEAKRGLLVVGASVAALTAGWYIYRWYRKEELEERRESEELVEKFDQTMETMNRSKRTKKDANGRHRVAAN